MRRHYDPYKSKDQGSSLVYNEFMHAWITYELVQVLHIYGLMPSVRSNLKNVPKDLFKIETFLRDRTTLDDNDSKYAAGLIQHLFAETEHSTILSRWSWEICHTSSSLQPMLYHFSSSYGCNNLKRTSFIILTMTASKEECTLQFQVGQKILQGLTTFG
jgi:hypothetical protein